MNSRFQHPQVKARKDRPGWPRIFRYRAEELQPDGSLRTLRKYREIGPSKGKGALTLKQAEAARDELLALNEPGSLANAASDPTDSEAIAPGPSEPVAFGRLARLYVDGYLARRNYVAEPTRQKEEFYIREYLLPKWGIQLAGKIQSKAVEDWLHTAFAAWWTMHGVRGRTGSTVTPKGMDYGRKAGPIRPVRQDWEGSGTSGNVGFCLLRKQRVYLRVSASRTDSLFRPASRREHAFPKCSVSGGNM